MPSLNLLAVVASFRLNIPLEHQLQNNQKASVIHHHILQWTYYQVLFLVCSLRIPSNMATLFMAVKFNFGLSICPQQTNPIVVPVMLNKKFKCCVLQDALRKGFFFSNLPNTLLFDMQELLIVDLLITFYLMY